MQQQGAVRTHCQRLCAVVPGRRNVGDEVGVAGAPLHARCGREAGWVCGGGDVQKVLMGTRGVTCSTKAVASEQHLHAGAQLPLRHAAMQHGLAPSATAARPGAHCAVGAGVCAM